MPNPTLGRDVLRQFLPDHQAIKAFEKVLDEVSTGLPNLISDAANAADSAGATAHAAIALLAQIAGALDALLMAPVPTPPTYADDFTRATYAGTLAAQDYDHVDITGGRIGLDAATVGAPALYLGGDTATGLYRIGANNWGLSINGTKLVDFSVGAVAVTGYLTVTTQLKSTVAIGTPPLVVTSTDEVTNLRAAKATALANPRNIGGVQFDGTADITVATATDAGGFVVTHGFGCNGQGAQGAYASGAALGTYGAGANGFDTAGAASALHAKVKAIDAALAANGIITDV